MKHFDTLTNYRAYEVHNFQIETLQIRSQCLKDNPLNDSATRFNPLLLPKNKGPWPVVLVLGGFSGNAPFYFNAKFNEQNTIQVIDQACSRGEAPEALYVFVDALTTWGGAQFLNSSAVGNYQDYIMTEIVPALSHYPVSKDPKEWCVMGGSSGGYGALQLASLFPETFGLCAAIAPDSFFDASIINDLYQALPVWEKYGQSGLRVLEELRNGKLTKFRNWHSLLNAFGMSACYSPKGSSGDFHFPLDPRTGNKIVEIWEHWLEKDPVHFLPKRRDALRKLHALYLDVGTKDNFHLQYGARQISAVLTGMGIAHDYVEFDGNHFDIGERRPEVWKWLTTYWRK
ncbi:esterase family protein [Bdellovibrio sp. KM01]|uniref:alpha/beta hydrolase n=1 Tax=Bdellovibrio sp. KM01 TaxID=2748865 RepID=UPI0015EA3EF5|nr:alpha/beta hydrolase-fold protein [Bdellovibrio sp. KM01]QLY26921.1 enterochelin esterase [Bdellovibrio sp. KM01]